MSGGNSIITFVVERKLQSNCAIKNLSRKNNQRFIIQRWQDRGQPVFDTELEMRGNLRQVDAERTAQFAKRAVKRPARSITVLVCIESCFAAILTNLVKEFTIGRAHGAKTGSKFRVGVQLAQLRA